MILKKQLLLTPDNGKGLTPEYGSMIIDNNLNVGGNVSISGKLELIVCVLTI